MALQKQVVSIPLTGGIDRKTDKHQLSAGQMYTADNVQYISQKQLSKRYGCQTITPPGGLQGAPFTAIGIRDNVEPVIQGGNVLNRYNPGTGLATSTPAPTQGRVDSIPVASSTGNTTTAVVPSNPSCATDGQKYICVAWEEPQAAPGNTVFYWGIQDLATGNWIISPRAQVGQVFGGAVSAPKVIYVSGAFVIFFIEVSNGAQVIESVSVSLTNLAAGTTYNSAGAVQPEAGGSSTNLYGTWGLDVFSGFSNSYFSNAVVVAYNTPTASGTSGSVNIVVYNNANVNTSPSTYTSATMGGPATHQKVALSVCNGVLIAATQQQIVSFKGASLAPQTVRLLSGSFTNASGTFNITNYAGAAPALLSLGSNVLWYTTVYTVDAATNFYLTTHNVMAVVPLSGTTLSAPSSIVSVDPPNNTLQTSYLTKPFFNNLTQNTYAYIGAGGYSDANTYANAFLMEIPTPGLGMVSKPIARLLYGVTANISKATGQSSPTEVIPSLTGSRFLTYLSTQTFDASFSSAGVPLSYYGNLNLTGFDFTPARGNQLLTIPQGGVFATSAFPWEYDGQQVVEAGFSAAPAVVTPQATGTSGSLAAGTYWYKLCFVKRDAYGNVARSSPSNPIQVTTLANGSVTFPPLSYAGGNVYVEFYRSVATTTTSASAPGVYYLTGSVPQNTVFIDTGVYPDSTLQGQPTIYTASGEIENDPPPPVHHMAFGEHRAFIIPSDARNQIWYSKPYYPGKQLEWSANFTVNEGANAGLFTAVAVLDSNIICFKADSIAYFYGDGPDATGANGSFSNFQKLSSDVGCIDPGSIAIIPNGLLFRSRRGIELLTRGLQVTYVGFPVEPIVQAITTIGSVVVLPVYTQVRFVPNNATQPVLVYDYGFNRWSTYSSMASVQANNLNGQYWWISADGMTVNQETPNKFSDNGSSYFMTLVTPELQFSGIQGWGRAYRLGLLGDFKSSHTLSIQYAYDHTDSYLDLSVYNVATLADLTAAATTLGTTVGMLVAQNTQNPTIVVRYPQQPEQVRMSRLPRQRMQTMRVMISDSTLAVSTAIIGAPAQTLPFGESLAISDLTLEYGQKAGIARLGGTGTV